MCASAFGGQERVSDPQKLELQAVELLEKWVLGTKAVSSRESDGAPNC